MESDDNLVEQSLKHLKKVIATRELETVPAGEGSLLFKACACVADKIGVSLLISVQESTDIEEICSPGVLRHREITLQAEWWKEDHGHFVGFYKKEKRPVSVIFYDHKEYHFVDPETQEHTVVDEKTAHLLVDEAIMLYPSLPKDVGKFRGIFSAVVSKMQWEYTSLFLIGLAALVLGFALPFVNKVLFDYVIPNYNFTVYTQLFIGLFVILLSSAVFSFFRAVITLRIRGLLTNKIQITLWDRLLRLPLNFFRTITSGDLLERTMIFEQIKDIISSGTLTVLLNSFFGLFYLVLTFYFSWQLTLLGLSLALIWSVFVIAIAIYKIRLEKKLLASTAEIQSFLVQVINGINKVRSAALEKRIFSKWARSFSYNQSLTFKIINLENVVKATAAFMKVLLPLSIYGFVIYKKSQGQTDPSITAISIGTFLGFLAAFTPFSQSLLGLIGTLSSITELYPFWKRVGPLLTTPPEKTEEKADPGRLKGQITVRNLHFRYGSETPLILKDLNLSIRQGEFVGLVGKTGCGKSTLCRILFGFEACEPNTLFFDDQDMTEIDVFKLRKQIGFVHQENKIFNGNIYDNLTCGRRCSSEMIEEALAATTFDEILPELPMGLDTMLSSIGGLLSGGQKQKILLARALLADPSILIIDEGLNTLDNQTQERVLNNMKALGKTIILTSHRLNVLEMADQIFVMDDKKIIASGKFRDLAKQEGIFMRFVEKQFL